MSDHTWTCGLCRAESVCKCGSENLHECKIRQFDPDICQKCTEDCVARNYKCYNCDSKYHLYWITFINCESCAKKLCSDCASGFQDYDLCDECMEEWHKQRAKDEAAEKNTLKPE